MLAETYASWLRSATQCCGADNDDDNKHAHGESHGMHAIPAAAEKRSIVVLRDQPAFVPPPSAELPWTNERTYAGTPPGERGRSRRRRSSSWSRVTAGTPWFTRPSSSSRRPKISGPSNFRHLHSDSFQFPSPQPTQKRFSFRPLELNLSSSDSHLSPLLPYFEDGDEESRITPPPRAHTAHGSRWDESNASLNGDRSYSSTSFHIPRKHLRDGSSVTQAASPSPPSIPAKSRARAYTSPNVEGIVERIASAMIERERLEAEIESVIERQSLYISSRPSTAYGLQEMEPMPSIPALPAAAPSFAERLSTESRPYTAAPQAPSPMTQERTLALAAAAFNSHPFTRTRTDESPTTWEFRDDRSLDRPLAPPLPLVLRPPLRKKKSFSRVSNWLFPGDEHRRVTSLDSVTNSPQPIRGNNGYYQCVTPPKDLRRTSVDTDSSLSTWETEDEGQTVPTTLPGSPGSSPVVQHTPKHTPIIERAARFGDVVASTANPVRPQRTSVGVAF